MTEAPERITVTFNNWRNPNAGAAYQNDAGEAPFVRADLLDDAVKALEAINSKIAWEINPSNYDHQDVCDMNSDWCEVGMIAETTLAKLRSKP